MLDVSDWDNPTNLQEYFGPSEAIDHNQYILQYESGGTDYIFQANYRAGMRILEVIDYDTADFEEVGYFDIYPTDDEPTFNGAWSVYPYFPSEILLVSGISEGLFILSPNFKSPPTLSLGSHTQSKDKRFSSIVDNSGSIAC